ncbi:eCIS core domain-containing protein [Mesorhizobium japonicum]|uniref:Mlr6568 protein n=1 Tax=Mesorhizobium japonicum (strain LMG 29417 / CECT 9101 / MAFF 303099) TaxID=266835 RepID=Q988W2_RHILO|nr:DUF4157 domain-containing protein [Mesorhizobium japonicum]BAB52835.1 mlr6568 [Mesorhizobium japonicum MAFF 303099]
MPQERVALTKTAVAERRPAATAVYLSAGSSPAAAQRVASRLPQSTVSRSAQTSVAVSIAAPTSVRFARVSQPSDPAEVEARETARKVVQMGTPAAKPAIKSEEETKKNKVVQRTPASSNDGATTTEPIAPTGGTSLPSAVRSFMEPRFGADFANVRIHTGEQAAQQSANLNAHAFTVGEHVSFGRNQYQPESADGRELIAHELTHTIQQGAVIQRSAATAVSRHTAPRVQRLGIGDALNFIADAANFIPGFRLLTIVLGTNPINLAPVERSPANILRALLELIPIAGMLLSQALDAYGIFAKVGGWAEAQFRTLGMAAGTLKAALTRFLDSLSWKDVFDLDGVWERGKRIFTEPIDRLIAFGKSLATGILGFIREVILLPLAKLAEGTRGYDLLKAVLGQDPVTGEPVPRTPETLIGGFLKLIGQEDIWENMKKANAIPRAWAWFQAALAGLMGFIRQIPSLFMKALNALEIVDLVLPLKAFTKLVGVFGDFVFQFVTWGGNAAWNLLEIIFDVVSPGALVYVKKTGAALKSILKNPLPFVGNLVKAAKLGFVNFADHFLGHLKAGLIDWLTGSLPGIYIPKAFSLVEIGKFVFSVLGLSWANIRQKLVKATSETVVKALETGFDIVVTLVRDGPAAAWDKIKEQLTNLKDMVISGITDFVVDMVVKRAIPKLIAMFIPGAGFISAILSIYDTIMVFVNKISKIIQVVTGFIDSIVAIASGAIGAAATRVENVLAGLLSLAINFLAGFAGLGKVADKVMAVIEKVRAPIDKALDWLVNWIVTAAKKLFAKVFGKKEKPDERTPQEKDADLKKAMSEAQRLLDDPSASRVKVANSLTSIKKQYRMSSLDLVVNSKSGAKETVHVHGVINPQLDTKPKEWMSGMELVQIEFNIRLKKFNPIEFRGQLSQQERGINKMKMSQWAANRAQFLQTKEESEDGSGRSEASAGDQRIFRDYLRGKIVEVRVRSLKETKDQAEKFADNWLGTRAALHGPDQIAAGGRMAGDAQAVGIDESSVIEFKKRTGLVGVGSARINSSIGSQWKSRISKIDQAISDDKKYPSDVKDKANMNVQLTGVELQ